MTFLVNIAYYATVIVLVYLGIKYALGWVLPFILAFCIVSIVNPAIRFVNNKLKFSHKAASITVMILVYGLIGFVLFELIMQLYYVMRDVFTTLPAYYDTVIAPTIQNIGSHIEQLLGRLPLDWEERILGMQDSLMSTIQSWLLSLSQSGMGYVTRFTGQIPSFAIAFVFTITLSFLVGMQYDTVIAFIKAQLPEKAINVLSELKVVIYDIVFRYLKAIFKLMMITFVELAVGLLILRTSNAVTIALGIAVFDALPLFGTGAIMIPWTLVELLQGNFSFALGLIILYAIVTVVRNIIEPHIVGQKLGLNPIASIVSIYIGYKLLGIFGMIIMPIVVQITMELHNKGVIRIFKPIPVTPEGITADIPVEPDARADESLDDNAKP
ncbi:sporulation integral membrane protein YtvI [Ruminococcaceae bacterium OttesenSCG-928-L11]|nr:sporulation integral membrane protein YtvI [Ruminococcaceae bacterium OttesenSCG-928-L11]